MIKNIKLIGKTQLNLNIQFFCGILKRPPTVTNGSNQVIKDNNV